MRLLIFSPWFPYPPDNGSRLRAWHLIRQLAPHHTLRIVTCRQDDSPDAVPEPLRDLCYELTVTPWHWYQPGQTGWRGGLRALLSTTPRSILETPNPELVSALQRELALKPDAVLAMELGADAYLPAFAPSLPVILDQVELSGMARAVTVATTDKERLARWLTYTKGKHYWQRRLARYRALTAVSEAEAEAVRAVVGPGGPPVWVVPNGVAVDDYPARTDPPIPGRLIYNGALSYGPNRDAVLWFVEAILPKIREKVPDAHLVVTGRAEKVPEVLRDRPDVVLTGFVPDLRPTLAEATVCVVPLRAGGGTRLKILEAWAAGLPVVATTIGAAGLERSRAGEHLLLADSADTFAQATVTLLTAPMRREQLARDAHALVAAHYNWSGIGQQLSERLQQER